MTHLVLVRFPDGSEQPLNAAVTHGRGTQTSLKDVHLSRQHVSLAPADGVPGVVSLTNLARNHGSEQPLNAAVTHGRGTQTSLKDVHLSRQHVSLAPVDGIPGVVSLTNLARNPVVVEVQQPDSSWAETATLQQGQDVCIGPGSRFYVRTRQESTTFAIVGSSSSSNGNGGGGGGGGGDADNTAAAAVAGEAASGKRGRSAGEPAAAGAAGGREDCAAGEVSEGVTEAASTPSVGRVWWQQSPAKRIKVAARNGVASPALTAADTASDAALAAALAAEEAAEIGPSPAAAAVGYNQAESDAALAAALAAEEIAAAAAAVAQLAGAGGSAAAAGASHPGNWQPPPQRPPAFGESPISLFAIDDDPSVFNPAWNAGCLGARLSELVTGNIQTALVSNFMFDWSQFPAVICPDLVKAKQVVIVEGLAKRQKGPQGVGWQDRAAAITALSTAAFAAAAEAAGVAMPELLCYSPEIEAYGCHHSKFFVLGYADGGVRVIVHTANLLYNDCFSKTQGLWWQDFPPKQQPSQHQEQQQQQGSQQQQQQRPPPGFGRTLADYVHQLKLPGVWGPRLRQLVAGADYSAARGVLIGSVPGRHEGQDINQWGHMALRSVLSQHTFQARFKKSNTVLQCSSVGTVNQKWMNELRESLTAAGGFAAADAADMAVAAAAAGGGGSAGRVQSSSPHKPKQQQQHKQTWLTQGAQAQQPPQQQMHLVWPTGEDVRQSIEGWKAGNSIPTYKKKISEDCLQPLFRRWGGTAVGRQQAMPHIKSFGRFIAVPAASVLPHNSTTGSGNLNLTALPAAAPQQQQKQQQNAGGSSQAASQQQQQQEQLAFEFPWWLVTSHNLSKSAWGQLQNAKRGGRQLFVASYELGVLCLPELEAAYRRHPHRIYCCTPQRPGVVPASCPGPVRFIAWNQPPQQQQQQQPSQPPAAAAAAAALARASGKETAADGAAQSSGSKQAAADGAVDSGGGSGSSEAPLVVYLPVPFTLPLQPYDHLQADRPWCLDDPFPGLDRFQQRCKNAPNKVRVPYHRDPLDARR